MDAQRVPRTAALERRWPVCATLRRRGRTAYRSPKGNEAAVTWAESSRVGVFPGGASESAVEREVSYPVAARSSGTSSFGVREAPWLGGGHENPALPSAAPRS